jgi:hypothetical protein
MWNSDYSTDSNNDDQGAFVHLVNENTSWHGHTMMAIEYNGAPHTYWGVSFQPKNEGEGMTGLLVTGVPATLIDRTYYGQQDPGIQGVMSSNVLSYVITSKQKDDLQNIINREKQDIQKGTVIYATIGIPIYGLLQSGKRDTCYSWAVRVLREAGIISSAWIVSRPFSMAPKTAELFRKQKR